MNNYYPFPYTTQPRYQQMPITMPQVSDYIRPVSSLEEVKASSISFDGSVFYFPDVSHKKIYTKQINLDGTASLNMYELTPIPTAAPVVAPIENPDYVTREEFNSTLNELKNLITQKGEIKNDAKKSANGTTRS